MEDINIAQIRAFVTVVDSGGFTPASIILGRTQSAISAKIRQLEEDLGVVLLERTTRSVNLNRTGRSFIVNARDLLKKAESVRSSLESAPTVEPIRIGIAEHFIGPQLLKLLAHMEETNPSVPLNMSVELTGNLLEQLDEGLLDVVIASHRPERRDARVIHQERCFWVTGKDYALPPSEPIQLITTPAECHYRQMATDSLDRVGLSWRVRFTTSSIASAQAAIMAGLGVSIVGQSALSNTLRILSLQDGFPTLPTSAMSLYSAHHHESDEGISAIIDTLTCGNTAESV